MTSATAEPLATFIPATGFSPTTSPLEMVELVAWVSVPTFSPAPVMAVVAAACVSPTTFGTVTGAGPDETTRATDDPLAALVAAAGVWLTTLPLATVVLDACVTVPTVNPAPVIAVVATDCVSPTTFGTLTWAAADPSDPSPHAVTTDAIRTRNTLLTAYPLILIMFKSLPLFRIT
jgi:hypothetical protein